MDELEGFVTDGTLIEAGGNKQMICDLFINETENEIQLYAGQQKLQSHCVKGLALKRSTKIPLNVY
jgi:hypothetical protein